MPMVCGSPFVYLPRSPGHCALTGSGKAFEAKNRVLELPLMCVTTGKSHSVPVSTYIR